MQLKLFFAMPQFNMAAGKVNESQHRITAVKTIIFESLKQMCVKFVSQKLDLSNNVLFDWFCKQNKALMMVTVQPVFLLDSLRFSCLQTISHIAPYFIALVVLS